MRFSLKISTKNAIGLLALIFDLAGLRAENFSLMLSSAEHKMLVKDQGLKQTPPNSDIPIPEEVANKGEEPEREPLKQEQSGQEQVENSRLFLSAILYFAEDQWSLILNDQIINGDQSHFPEVILKQVYPDYIVLCLTDEPERDYILKINQRFCLKQRKIISEGASVDLAAEKRNNTT